MVVSKATCAWVRTLFAKWETPAPQARYETARAAVSISLKTSRGWEIKGTWLESTSTVLAAMRFARKRSISGLRALSFFATIYHEGIVFQAALGSDSAKM